VNTKGSRSRRLRTVVTGVPFLVTAGVLVFLALAYTLAGFFLLPRLIRTYAPRYVEEQLKRRLEIGEVRVNPLLFKVEIKQFRLQEADGRPLLGFDRLFVDFELSSLFRRAWTFAEIQLDAPRLDVVMARDGRVNLADLLAAFPQGEPSKEPAPAPRRIAAALDFSRADKAVLSHAVTLALAGGRGAKVLLFHVVESGGAVVMGDESRDREALADQERLEMYAGELTDLEVDSEHDLGFGDPAEELAQLVEKHQPDLILLGSHGHRAVGDLVLGTSVERLRHRVRIPVMVIPAE